MIAGMGSSPRMRGSQPRQRLERRSVGIIPAHAGLTRWRDLQYCGSWDHPRACGAHDADLHRGDNILGSSPRMRGSLFHYPISLKSAGIIPAHAGLTCQYYIM